MPDIEQLEITDTNKQLMDFDKCKKDVHILEKQLKEKNEQLKEIALSLYLKDKELKETHEQLYNKNLAMHNMAENILKLKEVIKDLERKCTDVKKVNDTNILRPVEHTNAGRWDMHGGHDPWILEYERNRMSRENN